MKSVAVKPLSNSKKVNKTVVNVVVAAANGKKDEVKNKHFKPAYEDSLHWLVKILDNEGSEDSSVVFDAALKPSSKTNVVYISNNNAKNSFEMSGGLLGKVVGLSQTKNNDTRKSSVHNDEIVKIRFFNADGGLEDDEEEFPYKMDDIVWLRKDDTKKKK
jgi:hypothetical protein